MSPTTTVFLILSSLWLLPGTRAQDDEVCVYVSLDEEHSSRILKRFEAESGIKVRYNPDTEDNKTVGLVNKIIAEGDHPIADVFWNNECGQTERLKAKGLLASYVSPAAADIPKGFKDPDGTWTGFAARARVLIWNTTKIKKTELPLRIAELSEARFASKLVMAKPLTGTTFTHAGALYAAWGVTKTEAWLADLKRNGTRFERGNAQVARLVAEGEFAIGLTDTDDVNVKRLEKFPVEAHYLDQEEQGLGSLVIPNSIVLLKNARHPVAARKLIDFVLSKEVEKELAEGASAQIPVRDTVPVPDQVVPLARLKAMPADWSAVGRMIEAHKLDLEARFLDVAAETKKGNGVPPIVFAGVALVLALAFAFVALRPRRARPKAS